MREIKFRAWGPGIDKTKNTMHYNADISSEGNFLVLYYDYTYEERENYILMQYTNLKDKNDKEIYESDVVADQYGYMFEIVFKDGCWFAGNSEVGFSPKDTWNVIGNIYEDSHLLERVTK